MNEGKKRPKRITGIATLNHDEQKKIGYIEKYLSEQDVNTHNKRKIIELFDKKKRKINEKTLKRKEKKFPTEVFYTHEFI